MREMTECMLSRRTMIGGMLAAGIMALPACTAMKVQSMEEAVRKLLFQASESAFARLTAPGGFYDDKLDRIELPGRFAKGGHSAVDFLTSAVFKGRLEKAFGKIAEKGAEHAAPIVVQAIRSASIPDAERIIRSGPSGATEFLRQALGGSLIEAMVPAVGDAIRLADEPLVAQAIASLTGIDDAGSVARNIAGQVDDRIWAAIGREEAAMRAHPESIKDPMLRRLFKAP